MTIDEDTQAQIQSFTVWAASRGYHVIGALIGPKDHPLVQIFATAPNAPHSDQRDHVKKLLEAVNLSIKGGKSEVSVSLPLATN